MFWLVDNLILDDNYFNEIMKDFKQLNRENLKDEILKCLSFDQKISINCDYLLRNAFLSKDYNYVVILSNSIIYSRTFDDMEIEFLFNSLCELKKPSTIIYFIKILIKMDEKRKDLILHIAFDNLIRFKYFESFVKEYSDSFFFELEEFLKRDEKYESILNLLYLINMNKNNENEQFIKFKNSFDSSNWKYQYLNSFSSHNNKEGLPLEIKNILRKPNKQVIEEKNVQNDYLSNEMKNEEPLIETMEDSKNLIQTYNINQTIPIQESKNEIQEMNDNDINLNIPMDEIVKEIQTKNEVKEEKRNSDLAYIDNPQNKTEIDKQP